MALSVFSSWIIQALYHHTTSIVDLVVATVVGTALLLLSVVLGQSLTNERLRRFVPNFLVFAIFFWALNDLALQRVPSIRSAIGPYFWPGNLGVSAIIAALASRVRPSHLRRLFMSVSVAIVALSASSPLMGWLMSEPATMFAEARRTTHGAPQAVAVLLLDELGADAATSIAAAIEGTGRPVRLLAVGAAGAGTGEVIPALITQQSFPDAIACGATTICSSRGSLDFSKIAIKRPDVDLVGFFHPYCAIQGYRSCVFAEFPDSTKRWSCRVARRLGDLMMLEIETCQNLARAQWTELTDRLIRATLAAPFFRDGGLLYAHVSIPHPPGPGSVSNLSDDYKKNLDRTANFVRTVARKMNDRFGEHGVLIVTSDHGLRPEVWCKHYLYRYAGCTVERAYHDKRVPIIMSGQDTLTTRQNPQSNRDLFPFLDLK
jgi:hypothetical protein